MAAATDKYSFIEQSFTSSENRNFNLNFNQNERCPILIPVQSYSKSNCDKHVFDDCEKEGKLQSNDKSSKISGFIPLIKDNDDLKKRWKNENTLNSINKSTLSLHIAAYENSNEATAFDLFEGLKKEKLGSIKTSKQSFSDAFKSQNPFEFPRQQDGDQRNEPEIMQFKASQQLLGSERPIPFQQPMAFWDDFEDESASLIKKLDNESVTLQTIVDDPMCLMLIRDENTKIVDYFSQPVIFRQLFHVALNTDIDNSMNDTEQYQFAYQCCEVLCYQQNKLYNAYLDDEEILKFLTTFLDKKKESINHLIASFYARVLLSLYSFDHTKVLDALSKTNFLDTALQLLKFSAIAELLYNLTTCIPLESRDGVKKYFIENDFGKKLCNSFKTTNDFIQIENTGSLWAEFVKNMRDFCQSYSRDDDFLQHLEHPDLILELLNFMFPEDKSQRDPAVIVSGCLVLMAVLDRQNDVGLPSSDLNKTEERSKLFNPDADFNCEEICAKFIAHIIDATLDAAKAHDGDVLARSMIVLEGIFNTSQSKNHGEFVEQLKKANFEKVFDFVKGNPTISLLNTSLQNIVSYMLHCAVSEEDQLISYLFNDLKITTVILNALNDIPESTSNVAIFGARAFFYRLAERIAFAKEQSQNSSKIINHLADFDEWNTFASTKLVDYLQENSTTDLNHSMSTRNHSMSDLSSRLEIAVDEVVDIGINELEPTFKAETIQSPTAQVIENLEKLNDKKSDDLFERYRTEMQKDKTADNTADNDDELFDLLNRPSTKAAATMDVDDWPTSSSTAKIHNNDDGSDDELELFRKLKPATSQAHATDPDWPVTTLPPPLKNDDIWDDFGTAIADDFPKKEKDDS